MTTQTRADPVSQQTGKDYKAGAETGVATRNKLNNDEGKISIAQGVVQKIAGMACREMSGVHSMGTGGSRAFGAIRERIPGSSGPNVAQGVGVEVGETQTAIDLDIVVEYGVSVAELGRSIQRNVKTSIERMTGLEVVEVNVNVDDVNLPDTGDEPEQTRVT
ncbi:Asp23/Gls24 family envelope stress response protein [Actinoplanes sp. NPDC049118]|uniref:Asp23/Gls24 family envelope stress response protein n=1 Tax=Actinoplanes sp. NPDC049118 TaxID=3155769 RepID=UPI0033C5C5EB